MQETFSILGLTGYSYGLFAALGAALALLLLAAQGPALGLPRGTAAVLGALGIPLGLLLARLIFCLFHLSLFWQTYENPLLMLRFFDGGFSMTGLLMGLVVAALVASRVLDIRLGQLLDALAAPLALLIAFLRAGEGFTALGIGKVVEENLLTQAAPWLFVTETMGVATEYRMAVYRYEAAAALVICGALLLLGSRTRRQKDALAGDVALVFFSLYGASQMVLESLRDDGHLMITFLRVAQVAAFLMPVLACAVFGGRYARIRGKAGSRVPLAWLVVALCLVGAVLTEFSLDGRLTWGHPSLLRDYAILTALALALLWAPLSLFRALRRGLYAQGAILAPVPAERDERRL